MSRPERRITYALLTASLLYTAAHAQSRASQPVPTCTATQLSLGTDDENGNFNGMSHSGTLLVIRNLGPSACRLPRIPQFTFLGADQHPIAITTTLDSPFTKGPRPMGHGPVVTPIVVAAGAEATASLRWTSGNVYDHGACVTPATLQLKLDANSLSTPVHGQICGPDPNHLSITTTRLALDPVYKP